MRRSARANAPVRANNVPLQGPAQTQGLGLRDRQAKCGLPSIREAYVDPYPRGSRLGSDSLLMKSRRRFGFDSGRGSEPCRGLTFRNLFRADLSLRARPKTMAAW